MALSAGSLCEKDQYWVSTEIYTDSHFTGLKAHITSPNVKTNVIRGGGVNCVKRLLKAKIKQNTSHRAKLYIVCISVNDIPEGVYDVSEQRLEEIYSNLIFSLRRIKTLVQKLNAQNKLIIATIPPKDLRQAVEKYPDRADIELYRITTRHQGAYERFVTRVNNESETGIHNPLHADLRIHRSRGRSSKYFYNKLYDRLHTCASLKQKWFRVQTAVGRFHGV